MWICTLGLNSLVFLLFWKGETRSIACEMPTCYLLSGKDNKSMGCCAIRIESIIKLMTI